MYINSYRFGEIVIDGEKYSNDVLIVGDKIINWWRKEGHLLQVEDLGEVWKYKPEVLIIGRGAYGVMNIEKEVPLKCQDMDIKIISGKTDKAVKEFNNMEAYKKIACGLHLTC